MTKRTLLSLLCLSIIISSLKASENIEMIIELTRHGSRAPSDSGFTAPWIQEVGDGELTTVGQRQHYYLGLNLRNQYPSFFTGKEFKPNEFWVRSTPYNRTIESAFSHIIGLFDMFDAKDLEFANDAP